MMRARQLTATIFVFGLAVGVTSADSTPQDPAAAMAEAMKQLQALQGEQAQPVDKAELKGLVPQTLLGMPRSKLSATSAQGLATTIEADFEPEETGDGECRKIVRLRLTDVGVMQAWTQMANAMGIEIDEESRDGFKRTIHLDDAKKMKGVESWSKAGNRSELEMLFAGFSVGIDTTCLGAGSAVEAAKEIRSSFDRLLALREDPPAP